MELEPIAIGPEAEPKGWSMIASSWISSGHVRVSPTRQIVHACKPGSLHHRPYLVPISILRTAMYIFVAYVLLLPHVNPTGDVYVGLPQVPMSHKACLVFVSPRRLFRS